MKGEYRIEKSMMNRNRMEPIDTGVELIVMGSSEGVAETLQLQAPRGAGGWWCCGECVPHSHSDAAGL